MSSFRSSLKKCFNSTPFCWNQEPEKLYCYIVQPKKYFPKGDSLYKYNLRLKKWEVSCDGEGVCKKGCLVKAMQDSDPDYKDRVYYSVFDIEAHLEHLEMKKELLQGKE